MILALKSCGTREDLAHLLGYKASSLSYILYQISDESKYAVFKIKKKDGSDRDIHAPIPKLKALQRRLSDLLHECIFQIEKAEVGPYRSATAFKKGSSIVLNARRHARRRYIFNIDLQDFFPSIHIGRVKGFFLKDKRFQLTNEVATTIAQIACHEGRLPQGSPCSPIIANLVASVLDSRLARFAGQHGCRYTRYADDITFSTNRTDFPEALAVPDDSQQGWKIADNLAGRIADAGYSPNPSKTRMSMRSNRQMVTGLVVNAKANVTEEYYRRTRAMCDRLFSGKKPYQHPFFVGDPSLEPVEANLNYVEGRLAHIYWVKSQADYRSLKEQQDEPFNYFGLYRDFLLFKTFYENSKPLVITEGESDRIYIKLAALSLFGEDQDFVSEIDGKPQLAFRTFPYPKRMSHVVGLSGGTGTFIKTLVQLKDFSRRYSPPRRRPVVMLIDNDDGAKSILNVVKEMFGTNPSPDNDDQFLALQPGLYLVRTPSLGSKKKTFIESFLPKEVLEQEVGGKKFNHNSTFDTDKFFGKVRLAQIVASKANTIEFTGFKPLFERLRAAFNAFAPGAGSSQ